MSDLLNRLRERGDHERYLSTQNYVPSMRADLAKEGELFHKAAAHIATLEAQLAATCQREADSCKRHDDRFAALEAQLAAADLLADDGDKVQIRNGYIQPMAMMKFYQSIAAYRAIRGGGNEV